MCLCPLFFLSLFLSPAPVKADGPKCPFILKEPGPGPARVERHEITSVANWCFINQNGLDSQMLSRWCSV